MLQQIVKRRKIGLGSDDTEEIELECGHIVYSTTISESQEHVDCTRCETVIERTYERS